MRCHFSEERLSCVFPISSDELNPHTVILPAILPRFHPDLFMLYMLYHEQEDALYWQGIVRLGHLTDTKLLEFLDVQR